MTVIIELTPVEEARLTVAAQKAGLNPEQMAYKLVADHLPATDSSEEDPLIALFGRWEEEDAGMSPEELRQETRKWDDTKAQMNAERDRAGARRIF